MADLRSLKRGVALGMTLTVVEKPGMPVDAPPLLVS